VKQLLHYRIIERLGSGAMGEVYRAVDEKLGREVALKMLPQEAPAERTSQLRLVREARAASALNHPGIVTLHDIELADDGRSFIVMELVHGQLFTELRNLPWRRCCELVASVGDALAFAHGRSVLHRDIKSDNLMLTPSGQTKVLDFGLAKLREEQARANPAPVRQLSGDIKLTQAGQVVGTPAYMSPESFDGTSDVRSEVWSLGVVLYELLTGKRPFDRESSTATMVAIQLDDVPPPSTLREVPPRVDELVMKALAKDASARFADMAAFVAALREVAHVRARKWPWIAAAGGAVIAGSAITYVLFSRDKPLEIAIGKSQRITFDAECEEYPRLHPDGKRVVYDGVIDGDTEIIVRNLDGSGQRRLTHDVGWDYAAAVSPDGKRVAYVHEEPMTRTLRVISIDGGKWEDKGAINGYPAWSRAGGLLYGDLRGQIVEDGNVIGKLPPGARLYHLVDTPQGIALMWWTSSEADATALGELSRDGSLRVVERSANDYEGGLGAGRRGYYATRRAATEGNQLLFRAWGSDKPIVVGGGLSPGAGIDISNDGKQLVFSTCVERQYIARIRGNKTDVISKGKWQDTNPRFVDDTHVLITSDRTGTMQGWMLETGGGARAVTPPGALGAAPSPDGKQIVYVAAKGLAIVDVAGGPPRSLTSDLSDTSPAFDRGGKTVLFERTNAQGETEVFAVLASGGPATRLFAGAQPAAGPTDPEIVYLTPADATGARRVLIGTGEGSRDSGLPPAAWQHPRFSPDGKQLVVVRGFQEVVTVNFDGSDMKVVFSTKTGSVSTADFARDGSIIAALGDYDGDLWLASGNFP
jgi:tRNA A-37 threonylcarbamoyl transferase component Bud32/dipeptidyl aminopeptidase/acylaminoacyl peptidase